MCYACILHAWLRDILAAMTKQENNKKPAKGGLEKVEVWLPSDMKQRLAEFADREQRSTNKQAVYFIESGLSGVNAADLSRSVENIETMLAALVKRLEEK